MIKFLKYIFIVLISFIFVIELISYLKANGNVLNTNYKGESYYSPSNLYDVYFIGDSYASTNYVEKSYPIIFKQYFKSKKWNFYDLSRPGSELADHIKLLDSISNLKPKLIIYFYNISDVVSLNADMLIMNNRRDASLDGNNVPEKNQADNLIKNMYNNSATILLFKKSIQHLFLTVTDRYVPSTPAYIFPKETLKKRNQLESIFNSFKAENKLILINTPFNAGSKPKQWEQYQVFKQINKRTEFEIIQAVDIINDSKYGVSWRNAHPTQEAINIISDSLIRKFDNLK